MLTFWLALLMTFIILGVIYARIDFRAFLRVLLDADPGWFALALSIFIPMFLVTALRWQVIVQDVSPLSFWSAFKMCRAGKVLNVVTPAKLGEMSKAYFLKKESDTSLAPAFSAVLLEKVLDVAGLCVVLLGGAIFWRNTGEYVWWTAMLTSMGLLTVALAVMFIPMRPLSGLLMRLSPKMERVTHLLEGWDETLRLWRRKPGRFAWIWVLSILLWSIHVLQIFLFFPTLAPETWTSVPIAFIVANVPLAIFIGLLPISFAGMGTRDAALIFLFSAYAASVSTPVMAGVGLFCSMRIWVDTLVGIPFFHAYARLSMEKSEKAETA